VLIVYEEAEAARLVILHSPNLVEEKSFKNPNSSIPDNAIVWRMGID
jgi:hypothetical protein